MRIGSKLTLATMRLALALFAASVVTTAAAADIGWSDLIPESGQAAAGSEALTWALDGREVRIAGYVLPIDREGDLVHEFFLVPWAGACSHTPAPPPNQLLHVIPKSPLRIAANYELVAVSGRLAPGLTTTQFFMMDGVRVLESGYGIAHAEVEAADVAPAARPAMASPWKFLHD